MSIVIDKEIIFKNLEYSHTVISVNILYALSKKPSGSGNRLLGQGELEGLWYCGRSLSSLTLKHVNSTIHWRLVLRGLPFLTYYLKAGYLEYSCKSEGNTMPKCSLISDGTTGELF